MDGVLSGMNHPSGEKQYVLHHAMASKYARLIKLQKFVRRQAEIRSSDEVDSTSAKFRDAIDCPKLTELFTTVDYSYFIADYALGKLAKHFAWMYSPYLVLEDIRERFDASMNNALQEVLPEHPFAKKSEYLKHFFNSRNELVKELSRKGNVATLWIDDTLVKVRSAEIDFDRYGTRLHQTIREVLLSDEADFCMLRKTHYDETVTVLVVGRLGQTPRNCGNTCRTWPLTGARSIMAN
eukprot:GHVS01072497.1.p2 GENE.GHVS01072497.1~~GHVS01072497.1.p2  ORF type:complete len:238 (-),score=17.50 GHVS01072497.1:1598-2311(-)